MRYFYILFIALINIVVAQDSLKELNDLYNSRKFDEAIVKANEILIIEQNNLAANLILGKAYVEKGKYLDGEPYLLKVSINKNCPTWMNAWALNYLGRVEFLKNNKNLAKECFEKCIDLKATKNVTNESKNLLIVSGLDDFYLDFKIIESEQINFYFQPNSVVKDKEQFIQSRGQAFKIISDFFDIEIPKSIDFIVWNSVDAAKEIGIKQLGFANPPLCVVHSRADQTPGHEITHIITHFLANDQVKTRFINEGVAVCFDLSNNNRLEIINNQKEKDSTHVIVSIKEAWNNPTVYPEWVYYTLAGEFINRILDKWGKEKLIELLKNQTYDNAVLIYGNEIDEVIFKLENEINSK